MLMQGFYLNGLETGDQEGHDYWDPPFIPAVEGHILRLDLFQKQGFNQVFSSF